MSKAFTKETEAEELEPDDGPVLPEGVKNYITPEGMARLRAELKELRTVERPKIVDVVAWAAGNGDRSENGDYIYGKQRLRDIDRRIRFLLKRMEIAEIVDPAQQINRDRVFFGARVTYVGEDDRSRTVRFVGVDETRPEEGEIRWISHIARVLLNTELGDVVTLRAPGGVLELEVLEISYER